MTATMTYEPIIVCACGTSMHDNRFNRDYHDRKHHTSADPADYTLATRRQHEKAGWDVSGYPQSVRC